MSLVLPNSGRPAFSAVGSRTVLRTLLATLRAVPACARTLLRTVPLLYGVQYGPYLYLVPWLPFSMSY